MFLSELIDKEIIVGKNVKGVCKGVGFSLKNHAVKYLLCANSSADFCVSAASVESVGEHVRLSKLRPVHPQKCACVFINSPVYSFEGNYLGKITDLALHEFVATQLFTDQDAVYPVSAIIACQDAVILRREQPYPLGQRIPAPVLSLLSDKKDSVVTKSILRAAIQKGALIELTLSLPPFSTF